MAEVHCPLCGETNPDHLETCQKCGARLKPLDDSPGPQAPTGNESDSSNDNSPSSMADWMNSLRREEPGNLEPEGETRDDFPDSETWWLDDSQNLETGETPVTRADEDDGLTQIEQLSPDSDEESEVEPGDEETGDIPDWLKTLAGSDTPEEDTPEDLFEKPAQSFLNDLNEVEAEESKDNDVFVNLEDIPGIENEEDLPDWLETIEINRFDSEPIPEETVEELPDWLKDFDIDDFEKGERSSEAAVEEVPPFGRLFEEEPSLSFELDETLSVAEKPEAAFEAPSGEEVGQEETPEAIEGDIPAWLSDLEGEILGEEIQSEPISDVIPPFSTAALEDEGTLFQDDLPAWINEEAGDDIPSLSDPEDEELEQGEVPEWVEAMRPPDEIPDPTILTDVRDGEPERIGPLAGMQNLLRAEPAVLELGVTALPTDQINLTDKHEKNVELLAALVSVENDPVKISEKSQTPAQRVMRIILALGILLAILYPILTDAQMAPPPAIPPPETRAARDMVYALDDSAPVLVAFEYEPGLSGELDAAASGVVASLVRRHARLTLVSTSPFGPAIGERFLSTLLTSIYGGQNPNYLRNKHYVNLGYIPGGISGLQGFAMDPKRTATAAFGDQKLWELTNNQGVSQVWESPAVSGIDSLADYALTVLITDNPDTARAWIEQVNPALQERSLLMVTSAQAEPMVRPYFENTNPQVHGLVTGLAGGVIFEGQTGSPGLATSYWDSFTVAIFVSAILILIGGVYNIFSELAKNEKDIAGKPS